MHICGPATRYGYSADRIYTPPDALLPDYLHLARTLGLERVVFVQPSIYGTDNAVMLAAMDRCPLANRGVAVLGHDTSDAELAALNRAGIRGVRLNLVDVAEPDAGLPLEDIKRLANRVAPFGWHLELLLHVDDFPGLDDDLGNLPVDLVVGHLGYLRPGKTPADPGFQALVRLMQAERCWTKLTGPYRVSPEPYPYSSATPFAEFLIEAAAEQLLWGSDWPHVMLPGSMPNDGELLELLFEWAVEPGIAQKILVENPARLYGF